MKYSYEYRQSIKDLSRFLSPLTKENLIKRNCLKQNKLKGSYCLLFD